MGETREELRENFDEWTKAFESKGMSVNLGKTKLMVSGMEEEAFDSKGAFRLDAKLHEAKVGDLRQPSRVPSGCLRHSLREGCQPLQVA